MAGGNNLVKKKSLAQKLDTMNPFREKPVRTAFRHIRENRKSRMEKRKSDWALRASNARKTRNKQTWKKKEFELLRRKNRLYKITLENKYRELLEKTKSLNPDTRKGVTKQQLLAYFKDSFGNSSEDFFDNVFDLMDVRGNGYVEKEEFTVTMCFLMFKGSANDSIELAYNIFDTDRSGELSKAEFSAMIPTVIGPRIQAILSLPAGRNAFRRFLKQELCDELLMFYEEMEQVNLNYYETGLPLQIADKIVEFYIDVGSMYQANISALTRETIKAIVNEARDKNKTHIPVETFDAASNEVIIMLEQGPLVRFKQKIKNNEYAVFVNSVWRVLDLKPSEDMSLEKFKEFCSHENVHLFDFLEELKAELEDEIFRPEFPEKDEAELEKETDLLENDFVS